MGGRYIAIGLKGRPVKGRANRELDAKLAKFFKVSVSQIRIVAGYTTHRKVVEIDGASAS